MDLEDFDEKSQASWRARLATSKPRRGARHCKGSASQVSSCRGGEPKASTRVGINSEKGRTTTERLPKRRDSGSTSHDSINSAAPSSGVALYPGHCLSEAAAAVHVAKFAQTGPNRQGSTPGKQGFTQEVAITLNSKVGVDSQVIALTNEESSQGIGNGYCISSHAPMSSPDRSNCTNSLSNFSINEKMSCFGRVISQSEASSSTSSVSPVCSDSAEMATPTSQSTLLTASTEFDSVRISCRNKQTSLFSFLPKQRTSVEQSTGCTLPSCTQKQSSIETSPQARELHRGMQSTPQARTQCEPCSSSDTKASSSRGTTWAHNKYPCPHFKRVPGIIHSAEVNLAPTAMHLLDLPP